ncbi:hypothetical protein ASPSYDRAFT_149329 [Aspergillus sydowii CBS 593.65]|uniref:Peptidyl-prolyl cis-trans isomerase n=1 Tax=Aspergillus sydowii CBS 593.65 TaxID=1036612 RepID=A0A1L9TL65_9EURO|nr:uncharacterized protein ASPSYDRAFT_149329 [Aspergillus sydowii CBS 593.65]OJJ60168.1 hypothetical protein ASPSYDRAFT_149329 [Aspergillus sydowii CBS 593.65]
MGKTNTKSGGGGGDKKGKGKEKAKPESVSNAAGKGKAMKSVSRVNSRHILCEKFSKKEEALEKIRNGAKFDDVAREYSEDKARHGGLVGWKQRTELDPVYAQVAFELEPSTSSNPKYAEAKTEHGYHIIMVEGRE